MNWPAPRQSGQVDWTLKKPCARMTWPVPLQVRQGWGLCRASNTSPKLVTRYEARDERALDAIRARFEAAIREAIDAVG